MSWISQEQVLRAIEEEPELPGPIPDDLLEVLRKGSREEVEEFCRIVARLTKRGIRERILSQRG